MAFSGGASSPSAPSWIYDVFLSFYGKDTRKGFTSHLHATLKRKGIITFRDDEKLEQGKDISQELLKAIQKSQYAIIVISKRYAFSKWCLSELTKILECRTKTGMTVLPVFYHVDPSDVRKQKGSFAKALAKHGQNIEVDEERWKMWKQALKDIGNLSGWHIDDRDEATIIEDISQQILKGVNDTRLNIFEGLVGIGSRASELISLLAIGSDDVRFIGICGMGGIGKTTLAHIIYDRVFSEFEARCFVADIREKTQKHGVVYLQTQLVCEILHESGLEIWNTHKGIDMIARSARNRNVFIVLDDVDREDQLEKLAKSHAWFGRGSRIVVTSRDRHLLKRYVDTIYEITELSEDESLELFCWKAFKKDHPKEKYVKLSKDILHYAQGLPLAIEVFGSHLFGRKMKAWKAVLKQLKANLEGDIFDKLQISYEGLNDFQKELFLDIACFFDGQYDNKWKSLDDYFAINIEVLKDRCLVKDLGWVFNGRFWMHDLLKKMGQQIVYRECPNDPGKRSRLWCYEDIINVLNYNIGTNTVRAISLDLSCHKQEQLNLEGFSKMKRLKMLVIHNSQSNHGLHALEWYGDFSNFMLSNELRYLEWVGYPLENLPINFHPNKLRKLKMPYSHIKQLSGWKSFEKVKYIDMSYSCNLIEIPDFSKMSSLVELDLQYCRSLSTVHSSLGNLKLLKKLEMEGCDCLNKLPDEISLESLEYLNLAGCLRLENFPNISGNMKSLEFLDLIGTAIKELPPSFKGLSSLKYFNLCGSMSYRQFLDEGRTLADTTQDRFLEYNVSRQSNHYITMHKINGGGGSNPISCLHFLNVFSGLSSLKKLDMSYRNLSNVDIPHELCHLSSLEYLYLCGNKLTTIPSSIYLLPKLRHLYLRSCTNLKTLPKPSFSQLSCLGDLHLGYCKMVDGAILNNLSCFSSLHSLNLCDNKFTRLPNWSCFSSLRCLNLRNNKFRRPPDLIQLSQLWNLCLDDCTELEALPELPLSLGYLDLRNYKFRRLPDLFQLSQLHKLCLDGCTELEALPKLPLSLKELWISGCVSLKIPSVEIDGGLKSNFGIGVVGFDDDGRPHQILQLPSYTQIGLSSDGGWSGSYVHIVAPASTSKISEWFNQRITNSFGTIESFFQEDCFDYWGHTDYGGYALLILYQLKHDTFQEKRKKQKVDDPALPRFVCHFQFNEVGTKTSFSFYAPEVPSIGPKAFWTYIPFKRFSGTWELRKTNTSTSIKASIESFDINVEIECGIRLVKPGDLQVLAKVISDISPPALDFETCRDLLTRPCLVLGYKLER